MQSRRVCRSIAVEERRDLPDVVDRMGRQRDVSRGGPASGRPAWVVDLDIRAAGLRRGGGKRGAHRLRRLDGDHAGDPAAERDGEPAAASADVEPGVVRPRVRLEQREFEGGPWARAGPLRHRGVEVAGWFRLADAGDLSRVRVDERRPRSDGVCLGWPEQSVGHVRKGRPRSGRCGCCRGAGRRPASGRWRRTRPAGSRAGASHRGSPGRVRRWR